MPDALCHVETTQKEIFLTFDDGPVPIVTEWVLDILAENNIKATFFSVGDNVRKNPEIFKRIVNEGHSVGNHTYHHLKGWKTHNEAYYLNIWKWEKEVANLDVNIGNKPLFRPPYGQISFPQAKFLQGKFKIVMWSIVTGDFDKSLNKEACLKKSVKMSEPGTVIVFHDSTKAEKNLRYMLPLYIKQMKELDYTFSRLG